MSGYYEELAPGWPRGNSLRPDLDVKPAASEAPMVDLVTGEPIVPDEEEESA
jgi:hypothetical protein